MTQVAHQIQLANRIKSGPRSFRSIEHERVHNFHSKQSRFSIDKHERTAYDITNVIIIINVTQALIDVDT